MNTRVYLLVLSIVLIVESSPLPCSCKSGLNSPLESTACSCSEKVVIPAQFTAIKPPSCNCQSGGSQPRPQPIPCIPLPTPPQTVQPCIPSGSSSGGSSSGWQPCIPSGSSKGGSSSGLQPCTPSGSSSGGSSSGWQPCIPSESSKGGSSSGLQPCIPGGSSSGGSSSGGSPCVPIPFIDEESLFKRPSVCNCASTIQAPDQNGDFYFKPKRQKAIPVDPVSLALAYQRTLRSKVKEDQLAYGFKQQPIEQQRSKTIPTIHEEKLFDIKSKIIEFRKPKCSVESSSEELSDEQEDDEDEEIDDKDQSDENVFVRRKPKTSRKNPSYGHLGYHEVRSKGTKLVNKKPEPKRPKAKPSSSSMRFGTVMKVCEPETYSPSESRCHCNDHTLFTR